jgi:hypothetical protein
LEFLTSRTAGQQTVHEVHRVEDLFAFGQIGGRGQLFDQSKVERDWRATGLHKRPGVAHKIHAIFHA